MNQVQQRWKTSCFPNKVLASDYKTVLKLRQPLIHKTKITILLPFMTNKCATYEAFCLKMSETGDRNNLPDALGAVISENQQLSS